MSRFIKILERYVKEQDEMEGFPEKTDETQPIETGHDKSELPQPEEVAMDEVKYKTLLKALREALYRSSKDNLEQQRAISDVDVDSDDLHTLKTSENTLMSFLDSSETVTPANEDL